MTEKPKKRDLIRSLGPDEVRALKPLTKEEVVEALRKGNEERRKAERALSGRRFLSTRRYF